MSFIGTDMCNRLDFHLNGKLISEVMDGIVNDIEAAKDASFMEHGYEVSPIENVDATSEDMKDPSKMRRFRYYAGIIDMEKFVQYYTIKDGQLECDDTVFLTCPYIEGIDEYMEKYYLDDIKRDMKRRDRDGKSN